MKNPCTDNAVLKRIAPAGLGILALICIVLFLILWLHRRSDQEFRSATPGNVSSNQERGNEDPWAAKRANHEIAKHPSSDQPVSDPRVDIFKFELDEFDAAWAEAIRSGRSEADQLLNLSFVVNRMCQIGEPTRIVDKIFEQFGPGKSRCFLVGQMFMICDRLDALKLAFEKLKLTDEFAAAASGLSQNLGFVDTPESIDRAEYAFLGDQFDKFLQKKLIRYISGFYSKSAEELRAAVTKSMELQTTPESKLQLLSQLVHIAPFDCFEHLLNNNLELSEANRAKLLGHMFGTDPTGAMNRMIGIPGGEKYLAAAFQEWLRNDARKPIEWLEQNQQSLSPVQKDSARQGIAVYAARKGDCDVAWQWVGQIADPQVRKAAEGRVWAMERDVVRGEVMKNPAATIQSIIAGKSVHADYWIEEAVATWAATQPTKAEEWYQKNWNSLRPEKAQYVAAAFASEATKHGDTAAARQWLQYIQDAKIKERIQAGISKAEIIQKK